MEAARPLVCEEYRDGIMALLDGEIEEPQRAVVEYHVQTCPHCRCEYARFQQLTALTSRVHFRSPEQTIWTLYYSCVCHKIALSGGWVLWSAGALLLILTGMLMMFGFSACPLATVLGAISMSAGLSLLWLSYFCNCKH